MYYIMEDIHVLSWNVCFGCMLSNKDSLYDRSAQPLPHYCENLNISNNLNSCLTNVSKFIDSYCSDGKSYDFIGLQEPSIKNKEIISNSIQLQKMGIIHHKTLHNDNNIEFVSFYNKDKYNVLYVKCGNITENDKGDSYDGRPYQIIFLKKISDYSNYIFINIHNDLKNDIEFLEKRLSHNFNEGVNLIGSIEKCFFNLQNYQKTTMPSCFFKEKQYKVICVGDFNDKGANFYNGLEPFKNIPEEFTYLRSISVNIQGNEPPKTCCTPGVERKYIRKTEDEINYGDYILINNELIYKNGMEHVRIPDIIRDAEIYPTSDHLPVVSTIRDVYQINIEYGGESHEKNNNKNYYLKYIKYKNKYIKYKKI